MSTGVPQVGFYYVNGIANTDESASKVKAKIDTILQSSNQFDPDKHFVTTQLNDTAPIERIGLDITAGLGGALAVKYSLDKESKEQGDFKSRLIGVVGAFFAGGALIDFFKIQADKDKVAATLAARVSEFLKEDEQNIANLVLHSQGADVGYRSLKLLGAHKERIRVVTLGAMTTIPRSMCSHVTNYKFTNDHVSRGLAFPFETRRQISDNMGRRDITPLNTSGPLTHGVSEYLKEDEVQDSLLDLLDTANF